MERRKNFCTGPCHAPCHVPSASGLRRLASKTSQQLAMVTPWHCDLNKIAGKLWSDCCSTGTCTTSWKSGTSIIQQFSGDKLPTTSGIAAMPTSAATRTRGSGRAACGRSTTPPLAPAAAAAVAEDLLTQLKNSWKKESSNWCPWSNRLELGGNDWPTLCPLVS